MSLDAKRPPLRRLDHVGLMLVIAFTHILFV